MVSYSIYEVMGDDHPNEACILSGAILPDATSPSSGLHSNRALDDRHESILRRLEALCKKNKKLVTVVPESRQLWLFGDEANTKDHLRSLGLSWNEAGTISQIDGFKIRSKHSTRSNPADTEPFYFGNRSKVRDI